MDIAKDVYQAGGRNFMFINLPPIERSPASECGNGSLTRQPPDNCFASSGRSSFAQPRSGQKVCDVEQIASQSG